MRRMTHPPKSAADLAGSGIESGSCRTAPTHGLQPDPARAQGLRGRELRPRRAGPARCLLEWPNTMVPLLVRDIMTPKVLCMLEEENLERIETGMQRFKFRHLPVIDGGKLVGLVSQRDYLRASVSALDPDYALKHSNLERNIFVAEIMTRDVVSVRPDTPLVEAAAILRQHKFGCLPVTEADGTVVGIVTDYDFVGLSIALMEQASAEAALPEATLPPR